MPKQSPQFYSFAVHPYSHFVKLSVVIVNYNVKYFLEQCLKAVFKAMQGIDAEVWVVDNNSVDGSLEMVSKNFPWVKVIANTENVGFSKANNQALRLCKGEFTLLLNPDTVVEEESFAKCIAFMEKTPEAGALGVRMVDGSGRFLPESKRGLPTPEVALYKMFGLNRLFPKSQKFGRYHLGFLEENKNHEVEVLAGAFMFIRHEALKNTGLLDETFFMYGEDIDLSYRILKAGYKNYYLAETSIIHYKGESTKKGSANYVKIFYQAMVIFARKHYSGSKSGFLIFLINSFIYLRAFAALVYRFFNRWWLVLLDAFLLFLGMYFLKSYWEEHIKFIDHYPRELMLIHVPYYVALWVGVAYINLSYQRPFSLARIFRGVLLATVAILAVYSLFPESLRFSRGLIILGSVWALIEMTATRLLANFIETGHLSLSNSPKSKLIIVGGPEETKRVFEMLSQSNLNFIGFVLTQNNGSNKNILGQIENLEEIVTVFKADELIFCSKDVTSKEILAWMVRLGPKRIHYKIAPEASSFIIGSRSKNSQGELFTEEISLQLSKSSTLQKKRLFDILFTLLMLVLCPIWLIFSKRRKERLMACTDILTRKKTWVGYGGTSATGVLPKIPPGVFSCLQQSKSEVTDPEIIDTLNYRYARFYAIETDLEILLKNFL